MKILLSSVLVFIVSFLIMIYPSFVTSPGVDCLAGCAIGKGFPFTYFIIHSGGIASFPSLIDVRRDYLIYNLVILFFISLVPFFVTKVIKK